MVISTTKMGIYWNGVEILRQYTLQKYIVSIKKTIQTDMIIR